MTDKMSLFHVGSWAHHCLLIIGIATHTNYYSISQRVGWDPKVSPETFPQGDWQITTYIGWILSCFGVTTSWARENVDPYAKPVENHWAITGKYPCIVMILPKKTHTKKSARSVFRYYWLIRKSTIFVVVLFSWRQVFKEMNNHTSTYRLLVLALVVNMCIY